MAYEDGVAAYYDGYDLSDNPHYKGCEEYDMWRRGWLQAYDDTQELEETQG